MVHLCYYLLRIQLRQQPLDLHHCPDTRQNHRRHLAEIKTGEKPEKIGEIR